MVLGLIKSRALSCTKRLYKLSERVDKTKVPKENKNLTSVQNAKQGIYHQQGKNAQDSL
jgi:hypothetical protein